MSNHDNKRVERPDSVLLAWVFIALVGACAGEMGAVYPMIAKMLAAIGIIGAVYILVGFVRDTARRFRVKPEPLPNSESPN